MAGSIGGGGWSERENVARALVQMTSCCPALKARSCQWKRFHAPSSGYATTTFIPSGRFCSVRSSRGRPDWKFGWTRSPK